MQGLVRFLFLLAAAAALAGCASTAEPKWASDAEVARAKYVSNDSPSISLITVVSNKTGAGAHTALLVNGSQRVIFDPAGTFYHPYLPERNDVLYGMSDAAFDFYIDYHTRITYHTIEQTVPVSPEVAELALAKVQAYGAVPKAMCTRSTSTILSQIPGFEDAPITWFPNQLEKYFARLPGVRTQTFYDDDPDNNKSLIVAYGIKNPNP